MQPVTPPLICLTIAGSDPSGGAGLQADLRVFHEFGVHGTSVVSTITVQNSEAVFASAPLSPALVLDQLNALLSDMPPQAAKCGALGSVEIACALAERLCEKTFPLIVDPVVLSSSGESLLHGGSDGDIRDCLIRLLACAELVTPNLAEAAMLSEAPVFDLRSMREAAKRISLLGVPNVLVKGGHLAGEPADVLYTGGSFVTLEGIRETGDSIHGTGCALSAAITAERARNTALPEAVKNAKRFVAQQIRRRIAAGKGAMILP